MFGPVVIVLYIGDNKLRHESSIFMTRSVPVLISRYPGVDNSEALSQYIRSGIMASESFGQADFLHFRPPSWDSKEILYLVEKPILARSHDAKIEKQLVCLAFRKMSPPIANRGSVDVRRKA